VTPARGRAYSQPESGSAGHSLHDERGLIDDRAVEITGLNDAEDQRSPTSPNVTAHFTSDTSLASSNVTTYDDNGRQKVCLSAGHFPVYCDNFSAYCGSSRDAPITHWPIIGRPIIGAEQLADYRLIQKVPETGQKPAVHTV